jgi:hypothetical protein
MPLPCPNTVYNLNIGKLQHAESAVSNIERLDEQIDTFVKMNDLPEHAPVSIAVDAMTLSHDRSYLPGKNAFVISRQPLNQNCRRFPLHVVTADSGQATANCGG